MTEALLADPTALLAVFECETKPDLLKRCSQATIYLDHILIWADACTHGPVPMRYGRYFRRDYPEHLNPRDAEFSELRDSPVGPWASGKAPKAVRKVMQGFVEQRHSAAHVFRGPNEKHWHFFHFNQRDVAEEDNHWAGGTHIHLMNWLTNPTTDVTQLIDEFRNGERPPHGGLHIRCVP